MLWLWRYIYWSYEYVYYDWECICICTMIMNMNIMIMNMCDTMCDISFWRWKHEQELLFILLSADTIWQLYKTTPYPYFIMDWTIEPKCKHTHTHTQKWNERNNSLTARVRVLPAENGSGEREHVGGAKSPTETPHVTHPQWEVDLIRLHRDRCLSTCEAHNRDDKGWWNGKPCPAKMAAMLRGCKWIMWKGTRPFGQTTWVTEWWVKHYALMRMLPR